MPYISDENDGCVFNGITTTRMYAHTHRNGVTHGVNIDVAYYIITIQFV